MRTVSVIFEEQVYPYILIMSLFTLSGQIVASRLVDKSLFFLKFSLEFAVCLGDPHFALYGVNSKHKKGGSGISP